MVSQVEKHRAFVALHERAFVMPNPWDAGSARILTALGRAGPGFARPMIGFTCVPAATGRTEGGVRLLGRAVPCAMAASRS